MLSRSHPLSWIHKLLPRSLQESGSQKMCLLKPKPRNDRWQRLDASKRISCDSYITRHKTGINLLLGCFQSFVWLAKVSNCRVWPSRRICADNNFRDLIELPLWELWRCSLVAAARFRGQILSECLNVMSARSADGPYWYCEREFRSLNVWYICQQCI